MRVRRLPDRGRYRREEIDAILDEGFVCHVGFVGPDGPVVIPTAYGRRGDQLYLHGASANAMLANAAGGGHLCITVTLVDGLVLARSAFHHSINYRSVVVYGVGEEVTAADEKRQALDAIVEHLVPGRGTDARPPTDRELRATRVVRVPLGESSAKVRAGGPKDDEEDLALPVWAGELPIVSATGLPVAADGLGSGLRPPGYVTSYRRGRAGSLGAMPGTDTTAPPHPPDRSKDRPARLADSTVCRRRLSGSGPARRPRRRRGPGRRGLRAPCPPIGPGRAAHHSSGELPAPRSSGRAGPPGAHRS